MTSTQSIIKLLVFIAAAVTPIAHFAAERASQESSVYPLSLQAVDARLLIAYTPEQGIELQQVIAGRNATALSPRALGNFAIECSERFEGRCKLFSAASGL